MFLRCGSSKLPRWYSTWGGGAKLNILTFFTRQWQVNFASRQVDFMAYFPRWTMKISGILKHLPNFHQFSRFQGNHTLTKTKKFPVISLSFQLFPVSLPQLAKKKNAFSALCHAWNLSHILFQVKSHENSLKTPEEVSLSTSCIVSLRTELLPVVYFFATDGNKKTRPQGHKSEKISRSAHASKHAWLTKKTVPTKQWTYFPTQ